METVHCSAPGRCGIIGNPTDMYGGTVISCSIDFRAHVCVEPCDQLRLEVAGQETVIESADDLILNGDDFDVARAILDYFREDDLRYKISYWTDIPIRAGVAGSTALTVAMLYALLHLQGVDYSRYQVAELARYIELNHLRVVCGYQDAYMCTFGGLNYMDFRGKQFYREASEELYATVEPLERYVPALPFVLAHTGASHSSDAVHKPLRERWLEGEREVHEGYERISYLAREGKKALLAGNWARLGQLMNENHAIQRDLGGSGEANEHLIHVALEHGALGAKLAGAGQGGTIIALHPQPGEMIAALREAGSEKIFFPTPRPGVQLEPQEEETA
ncbi:MAG: galactokinase family protein [Chloroflexota bacterium]|nr:galactokinase family protein [Chloroflexota bacterium]